MRKEIEKITIGDIIEDGIYRLHSISKVNEGYNLVLTDNSGSINAFISDIRFDKRLNTLKEGVIAINAVCVVGDDGNSPLLKLKSFRKAENSEYKSSEIFKGLSEEQNLFYTKIIKENTRRIPDKSLRNLCEVCLNDETLKVLGSMPATVGWHCTYNGGALVSAAVVSQLAITCALQYTRNVKLFSTCFNFSLLVSAALLHTIGVIDYLVENPWRKSKTGVDRGYMSVLQSRIENTIRNNQIDIDDEVLARLLNILASSVPLKSGVKATYHEGIVLRHALMLFEELDMLDSEISEHEAEDNEECFYAKKLHRFVATSNVDGEKKGAA